MGKLAIKMKVNPDVRKGNAVDAHVGNKLRMRRSMLGLSQDDLGKRVGVTFQQVQKYERGVNRISCSRLYDFATALMTDIKYFFDGFEGDTNAGFAEDENDKFQVQPNATDKETLALVRAYYKITDPDVRKKVLALIKAMSEESN